MISTTAKFKNQLRLFLTGFSMGTADLIPGVSGGTIAFLSGIYEELIYSIKVVSGEVVKLVFQFRFKEAIKIIPFKFLVPLGLGLLSAILSLSNSLSYLLSNYPTFVWAFFFGLVLASTFVVLKRVINWDLVDIISFAVAGVVAYIIVGAVPVETPETLTFFFLSGAIAICAMILPGISGAFILLLMGKYHQVLEAVTEKNLMVIFVVALGAILGLALFSRILNWVFTKHHDISVAILAGFMLGSVRKIWPWKEVVTTRINSHGVEIPLVEKNILPQNIDMSVFLALALIFIGAILVYQLDKMHLVKQQSKDIENKKFEDQYKESLKNQ